jgi:hypothetical protein
MFACECVVWNITLMVSNASVILRTEPAWIVFQTPYKCSSGTCEDMVCELACSPTRRGPIHQFMELPTLLSNHGAPDAGELMDICQAPVRRLLTNLSCCSKTPTKSRQVLTNLFFFTWPLPPQVAGVHVWQLAHGLPMV